MTIEHFNYLERIALAIHGGKPIPSYPYGGDFTLELGGFVEPKERARGKNFYTPTDTRRYEAYVKEAASRRMGALKLRRIDRPVIVHFEVRDQIPSTMPDWQVQLANARLFFEHTGGDLDNKEKAVLDALNRVVYKDDRLVVQVFKYRCFHPVAGFKLTITPCGLTKTDLDNIGKLLAALGYENGSQKDGAR
jgi:Holliday junction resolvase RusA-like endonuclease